jgi:hypothetical protein
MELLGTIYLYKIRYGEYFGNAAGSCWRLLFVYALMPWLHGYRISSRPTATTFPEALTLIGPDKTSMDGRSLIEQSRIFSMMMRGPERPIADMDHIQLMENEYKDQIRRLEDENQEHAEKYRSLEKEKKTLEANVQKIRRLEKVNTEQAKMISDLEKQKAELEQQRSDLEAIMAPPDVRPSSKSNVAASARRRPAEDPSGTWDP